MAATSIDDFAVWPDGTLATLEDVQNGNYAWKSDDFEIVAQDNLERLRELDVLDVAYPGNDDPLPWVGGVTACSDDLVEPL